MLDAADVSARRLRWDELPDAHRAVYRDQWAAEREVADWFSLPSLTWEQERAALMAGRSLGWMPEGWVGIGGRSGSGRRESAGDAFGAKVTDCSACSDSVEEWPGNNIQNVNATDWEPDGDGGCVRTLTQRDYTGSCVAGTSGGTPDGGECNNGEDPDSPCYGSNTSKTKAYVYEDGQCYTKATCDCDGKEIRGGGQNCPDSQVTYTMRAVEDHSCSGTKRDAAWGGKEGPELPCPGSGAECEQPSGPRLTRRLPASMTVVTRMRAAQPCGQEQRSWAAALRCALKFLVTNSDLAAYAACNWAGDTPGRKVRDVLHGRSAMTFAAAQAVWNFDEQGRSGYHFPECEIGACCPGLEGGVAPDGTLVPWSAVVNGWTVLTNAQSDQCSHGLCNSNTVYLNVAQGTPLQALGDAGCDDVAALIAVASVVLHEMTHLVTRSGHPTSKGGDWDMEIGADVSDCEDVAYTVSREFRESCNARYGTDVAEPA